MMRWKLIALDLDGTLLDKEGRIPEENEEWIRYAQSFGAMVVLVSGRHRSRMADIAARLNLRSPMITTNGCEIWSGDGRLIERRVMPWKDVRMIHTMAFQHQLNYRAYCAEGVFESEQRHHLAQLDYSWLKVLLKAVNGQHLSDIYARLQAIGRVDLIPYGPDGAPRHIDVQPKGTGKANALRHLCGLLDIDRREVAAFGDDRNDIDMLRWAGLGVAMANGPEDVRAAADLVAPSNTEAGVGLTLRRLLRDEPA